MCTWCDAIAVSQTASAFAFASAQPGRSRPLAPRSVAASTLWRAVRGPRRGPPLGHVRGPTPRRRGVERHAVPP
eukprot:12918697-Alexandrium_andersonii.AAC.1